MSRSYEELLPLLCGAINDVIVEQSKKDLAGLLVQVNFNDLSINRQLVLGRVDSLLNNIAERGLSSSILLCLDRVIGRVISNEEEYTIVLVGLVQSGVILGKSQRKLIRQYREHPELIWLRLTELIKLSPKEDPRTNMANITIIEEANR